MKVLPSLDVALRSCQGEPLKMNDHDPGQGIDGIWTSIEVVDDQSPGHLDQNIAPSIQT